ncbi:MAG TPA: polysaccharide biosynthesis tyrosine autokinase [Chroococcales cyanobacterium]|jgi:capsular exopolysaccharide synthesis family protein
METEPVSQVLSISKRSRQLQELPPLDKDEVSTPPQKGLNLRPLLRTVQRKALLVICIAGGVTAAAFVWANKNIPPTYQGNFQLLVEPVTNEGKVVQPYALTRGPNAQQMQGQDGATLDYATQLEILKSPKMLSSIYERVRLRYPQLKFFVFSKSLTVARFANEKSPEPTKLLKVTYEAEDPKLVLFVLEVTAEKYLKYSLEERKSQISEGVKFIDDQLPELNARVANLQLQLQRLQQQNKLTDPKTQGDQLFTQVREITNQQAQTQRDLAEQKTLYANLQQQLELSPDEAIAASALSEDPNYRTLQAKIQEIDNKIAEESARFQPDSPIIQSLQAKRQGLLSLQGKESNRIVGQSVVGTTNNPQVGAFQNSVRLGLIQKLVEAANQIQLLEVRNQALAQTKRAIERQAQLFPSVARQYTDIQGQLEIAKRTQEQLLTQRETLRVEVAQKQVPWELVSKPEIPKGATGTLIPAPSKAKPIKLGGLVLGLLLGVGTAVLIEKFRNIFYTDKELEESIPLPLLGVIPVYKGSRKLQPAFAGTVEGAEDSYPNDPEFQKAFDSLYASIRFLFSDPPVRSLAVCSAGPSDGKSTVALNLALTAASMGQRVLLVDANLRTPQLHTRLNWPNQKGLTDLLAKKLTPNELIQRSQLADNLFVLTSGQPLRNSTKLLGSAQMQYLMEEFQATFDLVIYDTSHFQDFMDANFLAAHTDGILMVVAVGKTRRSLVMRVLEQLNTYRLPTLGVVANHLKKNINIPYQSATSISSTPDVEELPVNQPTGKWLDFKSDNFNEKRPS